ALIYVDDLTELIKLGVSLSWTLKYSVVQVAGQHRKGPNSHRHLSVARLVADAGPGELIQFRNGNSLDLRSGNLFKVHSTRVKYRDREHITPLERKYGPKPGELIAALGL